MDSPASRLRTAWPALPRMIDPRRVVRLAPMRWFVAAIMLQAVLHTAWSGPSWLPAPWNFLGLAVLAGALWLAIKAEEEFVWNATPSQPFEPPRALVTSGPYRWSRNPAYLSLLMGVAGLAMLYGSTTPWLALPLLAVVLAVGFVRTEESILQARFGPAYLRYRGAVRRWL
jgi:protein-S-isoprenylcysteine O-methyltransferase Ste14